MCRNVIFHFYPSNNLAFGWLGKILQCSVEIELHILQWKMKWICMIENLNNAAGSSTALYCTMCIFWYILNILLDLKLYSTWSVSLQLLYYLCSEDVDLLKLVQRNWLAHGIWNTELVWKRGYLVPVHAEWTLSSWICSSGAIVGMLYAFLNYIKF